MWEKGYVEEESKLRNSISQNATSTEEKLVLNLDLAQNYIDANQEQKAFKIIKDYSEEELKELSLQERLAYHKLYAKLLQKDGRRLAKSNEQYQMYITINEQIKLQEEEEELVKQTLEERQKKIENIEADFDVYSKELQLMAQKQQNALADLRFQKWISWSLVVVIAVVLIAVIVLYRITQQKRKANQLLALKSLRSQMNPHFIFNALNSVNSFISKNDERAANKFLSDFSRLMRMVLDGSHEDLISLAQEIQVIELYLKLEQYRFRDKFDYTFNIHPNISQEDFMLPPMLIQPFIENAVWHGLRYKESFGHLNVVIYEENSKVFVEIEDNGIGRKRSQELKTESQKSKSSRGLQNTKERIDVINELYKTKLQLQVSDLKSGEQDCGTKVKLVIPQIKE